MRRFAILLGAVLLLLAPSASQAGCEAAFCAERLIDLTDQSADNYSSWVSTMGGQTTLWCNIDMTAIDTGSVTFELHTCYTPGDITGACSSSVVVYALTTAVTTVTTNQVYVGPLNPTFGGGFADREGLGPLPPVWRIWANHASSAVATYTVDCWWK
jgi:hypothetical protein